MTPERKGSIENNGRSAAYNGLSYEVCPYKRSQDGWSVWMTGYFDVKNEAKEQSHDAT